VVTLDRSLGRFLNSIRAEPISPPALTYPESKGPPAGITRGILDQDEFYWWFGMRTTACIYLNQDGIVDLWQDHQYPL